jgi:hypothetical protein
MYAVASRPKVIALTYVADFAARTRNSISACRLAASEYFDPLNNPCLRIELVNVCKIAVILHAGSDLTSSH